MPPYRYVWRPLKGPDLCLDTPHALFTVCHGTAAVAACTTGKTGGAALYSCHLYFAAMCGRSRALSYSSNFCQACRLRPTDFSRAADWATSGDGPEITRESVGTGDLTYAGTISEWH